MTAPPHVIRRQIVELTLRDGEDARFVPEEVRRLVHARLLPVMDELLSSMVLADEVAQLDAIELDLGALPREALDEELLARVGSRLRATLERELGRLREGPAQAGRGRVLTRREAALQTVRAFLETGTVPWSVGAGASFDVESAYSELLDEWPAEVAAMLRGLARRGTPALRRLVKQFSAKTWTSTLVLLARERVGEIEDAAEQWGALLTGGDGPASTSAPRVAPPLEPKATAELVREEALALLLQSATTGAVASGLSTRLTNILAERFAVSHAETKRILTARARRLLPRDSVLRRWLETESETSERAERRPRRPRRTRAAPAIEGAVREQEIAMPPDLGTEQRRRSVVLHADEKSERTLSRSRDKSVADEVGALAIRSRVEDRPELEEASAIRSDLDEEGAYVENAGLVLVWPFLPRFFESVGLVQDRAFRSEAARERATLLLQYLAMGEARASEHVLFLNKLLCAWPLQAPLVGGIRVSKREVREAAEVLRSVLENWKALKRTSVAGLRASFLQREGHLVRQAEGWLLRVARAGRDALLEQLPWGVGLVLLPWMREPIYVEW